VLTTAGLGCVALLTIAGAALPPGQRDALGALGAGLALLGIVVGARLRRPPGAPWWTAAACGAACAVLAAGLRTGTPATAEGLAGYADLASRALTVCGVVGLRRAGRQGRPEAVIDASVVAVAAALLLWLLVVEPGRGPGGGTDTGAWLVAGGATLAVLLAAHLTRDLTESVADRSRTRPLTAAAALLLLHEILLHLAEPLGWGEPSGAVGLLTVGALGLLAVAALRRPAGTRAVHGDGARAPQRRAVALVGGATVLVPLLGLVGPGSGRGDLLEVSVAGTTVAVLLAVRLQRDVRRTSAQAERLDRVTGTDLLTGLRNGPRFIECVHNRLRTCAEPGTAAVLLVSVLRFSEINETLGMQTGDDLLRATAARLENAVGSRGVVGRLSGATFGVLLDGDTDASAAGAAADAIRSAFRAPFLLLEVTVSLEVAVGCVVTDRHSTPTDVLHRADVALAAARRGSDGVAHYAGEMEAGEALAAQLMGELDHAISASQVVVHFQPQVDLRTGRVVGVEALARWHHPQHGLLGPASFVPGTERTGLIRPLTLHVLDRSLAAATAWRAVGRELRVAVNLSVRNLLDPDLVDDVRRALERHGLPPHLLELEITETMVMLDPGRSVAALQELHALGVALAVDDYGTGYSSLAYLQRLPVDRLKIDRSFVAAVLHDTASAVIVRSTIELADRLGLAVVAEGVEDTATLAVLTEMGCAVGQGFGLGHPVPGSEVLAAVERIETQVVRGAPRLPGQRSGRPSLAARGQGRPG
jgi:diguanylate cyclase (GGDEF)-like protein